MKDYYISIDVNENTARTQYAVLFEKDKTDNNIGIAKFIEINECDLDKVAEMLTSEINKYYYNGKIFIPNVGYNVTLIDYIKEKGFKDEDIIKLNLNDIENARDYCSNIIHNKRNFIKSIVKLISGGWEDHYSYVRNFSKLVSALDNIGMVIYRKGKISFLKSSNDIETNIVMPVMIALSKFNS